MAVRIETFVVGPFQTNCYVLANGEACWVIDPGLGADSMPVWLRQQDLSPGRILLTHGHCDHIGGVGAIKEAFDDALVCCPAADAEMLGNPVTNLSHVFGAPLAAPGPDELIEPGQTLSLGDAAWRVLDTSGHTPGGVSFYCESQRAVIVGDALFAGGIGRTDFPDADAGRLIANIREHLLSLPDDTRVLPGHGPATTIGIERASNPYVGL